MMNTRQKATTETYLIVRHVVLHRRRRDSIVHRRTAIGSLIVSTLWWRKCTLRHCLLLWWERLAVSTVQHDIIARVATPTSSLGLWTQQVRIGCMGGNEGLRLRGYGCEHAFLVESDTVGAASIRGALKTGTTNLYHVFCVSYHP